MEINEAHEIRFVIILFPDANLKPLINAVYWNTFFRSSFGPENFLCDCQTPA